MTVFEQQQHLILLTSFALKLERILMAEIDTLRDQVAATVAAETAAGAKIDQLKLDIAGIQQTVIDLQAQLAAGNAINPADLTSLADALKASMDNLVAKSA